MTQVLLPLRKCFIGWLLGAILFAQPGLAGTGYQVDVWRADDGLPQDTVTSIVQTHDGYLWLSTQNGLVRFDGVSFKVFNQNNTPAIKNNRIVQLFVDHQGTLWIGGEQGNLTGYQDGQFTAYAMPGVGSTFNYARAFCDDPAGDLWIVSCEWRLLRLAQGVFTLPSTNWSLSGTRADAVACDPAGQVYVGTEKELAKWQDGVFKPVWDQAREPDFQVDFLAPSRAGGCWVAGNGRLRRFDAGGWVQNLGMYCWTNQPVYGLYEDSRNRVWVATLGSGLFRYDPDGTVLHMTTRDGLPTDSLRCVMEDREGNIWVGMEGGGLCRLKPAVFQALGAHDGLSSDQVMSMCEATDDSYWIGMNGNGLDHLTHGRVEHFGPGEGLLNGHVWSVVQDRQGTIWAGTWGGLFKWQDGHFINIVDATNIGGVILAMYEDHEGGLWLGQQAFGMLTRLKGGERSTTKIPGTTTSLDVRVMTEDSGHSLWIGTENDGLYRANNGRFTRFGKAEGLANESIWSLLADADGTLWIGTCGGGLSCWRNGKITTWTTGDGLINDVICQILEDDQGNLWLGSYGGVFCANKADLEKDDQRPGRKIHCVSYSKADGLPSIECQGGFQPSGYKSRDGRLWFPTIKGFAVVNPESIGKNPVPPIVLIEDLAVDGITQPQPAKAGAAETGTAASAFTIQPGKSHIEFHYTATSLTAPEKVQFKYRLEGLEKDWTDAGTHRTASYSRLPPGDYEFQVIACNNDALWNEQGAALAITILPFFWQTSWFVLLAGLVLITIIFAAVRLVVTRRLHRELERLEREQTVQRERTRIAKDIHDDLGASLTEIAILSELAQNPETPATEAVADLRKIATKTKTLTQMLDEIVWAVNPQRDTVENFVTYTCSYAEDFLRVAQIQCRLQLPPAVPEISLRTDLRHGLFLVVKETLNNIVKHAAASEVKIKMDMQASKFIIGIQDNGKGFYPPGAEAVPGEGLANMHQRVESLGGRFEISSQPGQGTQVRISVPIKT